MTWKAWWPLSRGKSWGGRADSRYGGRWRWVIMLAALGWGSARTPRAPRTSGASLGSPWALWNRARPQVWLLPWPGQARPLSCACQVPCIYVHGMYRLLAPHIQRHGLADCRLADTRGLSAGHAPICGRSGSTSTAPGCLVTPSIPPEKHQQKHNPSLQPSIRPAEAPAPPAAAARPGSSAAPSSSQHAMAAAAVVAPQHRSTMAMYIQSFHPQGLCILDCIS